MNETNEKPWPIALFGSLVLLRAFVTMLAIYLPGNQKDAAWTPAFLSFMAIALIGVAFGYWKMRRWGPWALGAHALAFIGVYHFVLQAQGWGAASFIYAVGLPVGVWYYRRMS